ncbi:MAG: DegT/DnrJ/EryC1/StrS family aminotransferase [Gammaproteobacteria bacterium]|nr:DegT/DnrJ/EryC1/StrS family aminotransferase [Gammaproteobacteria bacterium]
MHKGLNGGRIPVSGPWITAREVDYVRDAVASAWYAQANVYHDRFERAFAAYTGAAHAVALPSCTAAIHLSLLALGVGPGDEVVVPDVTWIASAAPVSYVGATPVFADIEADTWCLSAAAFEACVSPRTRAVIPVDLYGGMPDLAAISEIARAHGVAVIEDAAEALGSSRDGRRAGSFGTTGVFSFHGSKTLTTGEGGMLITGDDAIHARVLRLRDHGRPPGDRHFLNAEIAWKYKMSAMQAALGLAQLERIDELIEKKRLIFDWYRQRLADVPQIRLNAEPAGMCNSYWMVTVILDAAVGLGKEAVMSHLLENMIDSRPFFHPLSSLPAYSDLPQAAAARARNRVSYELSPYGVNLPSGLLLEEADVDRVCAVLRSLLGTGAR